jgi:integrase
MKIDLPHLLNDTDRHGTSRTYFRVRGHRMVRLYAEAGTPEFLDEYRRAVEGQTKPKAPRQPKAEAGSLRRLVEGYYNSAWFKTLGESTQLARRGILDGICMSTVETKAGKKQRGLLPYAEMRAKHVRAIRDEKIDLPEAANGRIKALGQVFAWAIDEDLAELDPTATVDYLASSSTGFHTWTVEEVRRFEERHPVGTKARLALAILLYSGVRRSDAVRLGPPMEQDGALHFTETKGSKSRALSRKTKRPTPKKRVIPLLPQLREMIDATPSGHLVYLVGGHGGAYKPESFGNWFRDRCNEAGLQHCSAHGLRKAGATIAANNGATAHQLMAIYGWETLRQAEVYTREANRTLLAEEAMHLVVPRKKNKQGA